MKPTKDIKLQNTKLRGRQIERIEASIQALNIPLTPAQYYMLTEKPRAMLLIGEVEQGPMYYVRPKKRKPIEIIFTKPHGIPKLLNEVLQTSKTKMASCYVLPSDKSSNS